MKNVLLILLFIYTAAVSFSKDKKSAVELREDTVYVEGSSLFIMEKLKPFPGFFNYFIKNLKGDKLAFLKFNEYYDPKEISSANPKGRVTYYEVTFIESNQKAEIPAFARQIKIAEFLTNQHLLSAEGISAEAEQEFILVNGNPFSLKRREMSGTNTIIINNNTTPAPKNGVNINFGN